ncbi:MAG: OB-fold domain-containing protein [Burkholderiaceae bacterium]
MTTTAQIPALPLPRLQADSARYWEAAANDRLHLQRCASCQAFQNLPRGHCVACGSTDMTWTPASGKATLASFSIVHRAPSAAWRTQVPYVLALVDLAEGVRLMLNVRTADPGSLQIGEALEIFFEPRGDTGFKLPQARRPGESPNA